MSLNTGNALAVLRGMTRKFDNGYNGATPYYPTKATIFESTGRDEQYAGLGKMPGMREWLGDRIFHSLRGQEFAIVNKHWEDSIAIDKDDIDDDRLGMYDMALEQLGISAAYHPDELMLQLQLAGTSAPCMDGQYFYDTDHSWGESGTQSNDLTQNAAAGDAMPTEDEFRAGYEAARKALLGFRDDRGKAFHRPTTQPITDLVLEVPLALQDVATRAIYKDLVNGGESNVVLDRPKIVTIADLDTDNARAMYLHRVGQPLKPFVYQDRQPMKRQMKGLDDIEFKDVKMMVDARYNAGYLAWWYSVRQEFN